VIPIPFKKVVVFRTWRIFETHNIGYTTVAVVVVLAERYPEPRLPPKNRILWHLGMGSGMIIGEVFLFCTLFMVVVDGVTILYVGQGDNIQ